MEGQVVDLEALMSTLGSRDDRGIADQGVVDTGVRHQVGLELVQVDVQSTIETQRRGDRADDLGDKTVQVLIVGTRNVQVTAADVVHSLVVDQECAVRVLDGAVGGKHSIVGLNDSSRDTRGRVHGELELALLAILGRQALEEKSSKTGTSATAEGVEDQETLQRAAVVYQKVS